MSDITEDMLIALEDAGYEEYLGVAFAMATTGGFSKGTANVSAHDVTKLKGILKHYAKMKHPFAACVRDNRKRFGDKTEAYCAVLKDLIEGNTKWRKQGKKSSKGTHLSEDDLNQIYGLKDVPKDFFEWLSEAELPGQEESEMDLAVGDVAWNSNTSWNAITANIEKSLNDDNSITYNDYPSDSVVGSGYFRVDDVSGNEALVCSGSDYYVVPFTVDKKGNVEVSGETDWTKVDRAWVETSMGLTETNQIGAEMHLSSDEEVELSDDGLIWKTILREGTWQASPGPGAKPRNKPIKVVREGKSDGSSLVISMAELKDNFDKGLVEHVTIPTSHRDSVLENTGYVKALKFDTDEKGRAVLKAAHQFTDPDVKKKVLEGSIANVSSGILFDYVHKETGNKNSAVLGHVALTNHPWLSDMEPFSVLASENLEVINFSEDQPEVNEPGETSGGGEVMSEVIVETPKFLADLGLSEDEAAARLAEYAELKARDREHTINTKVSGWEEAKKAPALVTVAKALLSQASDTEVVLNLSEDGKTVGLSAVDIIDRLMDAAPALTLAEDPVSESDVQEERPELDASGENSKAELSYDIQLLADTLFLEQGYSREDSIAEAQKRLKSE